MSCQIPIDVNDLSASLLNNNHHHSANGSSLSASASSPKRNSSNQNNKLNILAFIARLIYFRRLRLLRFYMAGAVILVVLFFLLKPNATNPSTTEQLISDIHHANDHNPIISIGGGGSGSATSKLDHELGLGVHKHDGNDESLRDLKFASSIQATSTNAIVRPITDTSSHYLPSIVQYPGLMTNFTYTLSAKDFSQMKDINLMQVRIREAAQHSWDNYCKYAWGFDMLKPRSKGPDHWFNLGLTIVDSADTLIMMGMTKETNMALDWLENELKFTSENANSNCFEMTIRILAGLLSAYHLTGREKLKQQAIEFGDILLHCYDTESRVIPYSDIDLSTRRAHPPQWNPHSSLSEVTSLQLEFRFLSQISGDLKYERTTFLTSEHIHNLTATREQKLLPMYISPSSGELEESIITFGARADSYYEYLLKQYIQTGIKWLENDYLDAMDELKVKLIRHTDGSENYTYVAEMQVYRTTNDSEKIIYYNKMDHLVCFLPGTLALGYYHFSPHASEYRLRYGLEVPPGKLNSRYDSHLELSKALARTCWHMYKNMGTGLSPEIASFVHSSSDDPLNQNQPELQVQSTSAHNILRPEFVETLFYLYHITGMPMYRNQAKVIFEAFQKYSRIPSGYSALSDVREEPPPGVSIDEALHKHAPDRMESFWLSETLKYLYLIFCDDKHIVGTILNNYVFNTEAHMFPTT